MLNLNCTTGIFKLASLLIFLQDAVFNNLFRVSSHNTSRNARNTVYFCISIISIQLLFKRFLWLDKTELDKFAVEENSSEYEIFFIKITKPTYIFNDLFLITDVTQLGNSSNIHYYVQKKYKKI